MSRPLQAIISIPALRANLQRARELAPAARVWAVVKANGYGHGLDAVIQGFSGADGLAMLEFEQAQRLRALGWQRPILMLEGAFDAADLDCALSERLTLVIHRDDQIDWLEAALRRASGALRARLQTQGLELYLKFNSGMNRLGFGETAFRAARERLRGLATVERVVLMTHFANADREMSVHAPAAAAFERACEGLPDPRSAANSATIFVDPARHGQWVRPGIMLYGASPFSDRSAAALGLRPAMELRSALIAIQQADPGAGVGYGSISVLTKPTRVGVVACGYADGYPRHAPPGTPILVDGQRCETVGRVAMDMLMVDLSAAPGAAVGSPVELWGAGLPIDEVATAAGTIGYELMCAIAPRVSRRIEQAA